MSSLEQLLADYPDILEMFRKRGRVPLLSDSESPYERRMREIHEFRIPAPKDATELKKTITDLNEDKWLRYDKQTNPKQGNSLLNLFQTQPELFQKGKPYAPEMPWVNKLRM
jgi:hypothetical protein